MFCLERLCISMFWELCESVTLLAERFELNCLFVKEFFSIFDAVFAIIKTTTRMLSRDSSLLFPVIYRYFSSSFLLFHYFSSYFGFVFRFQEAAQHSLSSTARKSKTMPYDEEEDVEDVEDDYQRSEADDDDSDDSDDDDEDDSEDKDEHDDNNNDDGNDNDDDNDDDNEEGGGYAGMLHDLDEVEEMLRTLPHGHIHKIKSDTTKEDNDNDISSKVGGMIKKITLFFL